MQPFNVKICRGDSSITFTVLPEKSHYSILFNDRIIGAIAEKNGNWVEVPLALVQSHDLEVISSRLHEKGSTFELPVEELGREISLLKAGLPEAGRKDICT